MAGFGNPPKSRDPDYPAPFKGPSSAGLFDDATDLLGAREAMQQFAVAKRIGSYSIIFEVIDDSILGN